MHMGWGCEAARLGALFSPRPYGGTEHLENTAGLVRAIGAG